MNFKRFIYFLFLNILILNIVGLAVFAVTGKSRALEKSGGPWGTDRQLPGKQSLENFQPADSQEISRNWSGYTATDGTYTGVSGTWTVPVIDGSGRLSASAAWVGIGGVESTDLIQAGTQGVVSRFGDISYEAFYERLPDVSEPLDIRISAGDSVTVSLNQQSKGNWLISFKNNTTKESVDLAVPYDSSLSSAEWILEAPSGRRRILPLANFGSIHFADGTTIKDGKTVTIAEADANPIMMRTSFGETLATTSVLNDGGIGFNVSRSGSEKSPSLTESGPIIVDLSQFGFHL